ncbi:hypothetical protein AWV80_22485 [Cupriavidus sp. UYMU48A]|nr:hypothetical protein AWV80_24980 [Cupriavidus sp. UYMU48A]KAF7962387.1 hypothetical protein AWV80_22485 [Cupriavidus sp. UYMU48A]
MAPATPARRATVINFYEITNNFYADQMNNPFQTLASGTARPIRASASTSNRVRAMTATYIEDCATGRGRVRYPRARRTS